MSKYLMLFLVTASLGLVACGKGSKDEKDKNNARPLNKGAYPNIPQTMFGQWKGPESIDNGIMGKTSLYINQTSVGLEVVCSKGRDTAVASFSVRAQADENNGTLKVLDRGSDTASSGEVDCTAFLNPENFAVQVRGNLLSLTGENKAVLDFTRIQ